jgi:hypothetical protein
MEVGRK